MYPLHFLKVNQLPADQFPAMTKGKTTYIYLSGNAYQYSYMTRSFFIDYKRMWGNNQIIYTFERGIFGLKVRKDFKFVYKEACNNF